MLSNSYFLLRTSVRACCSSCLGFDDAHWFEYMLVLYCKSFRFCRLRLLWSNVFSACCSRNDTSDTCKPTRQSAKTAVTKIFDVGRSSITLWSWRVVGGEMIEPCTFCRKGALSSVRYSLRAEVYFRKFSNFSTNTFVYWLPILASMSVIRGFPG